MRTLIIATLAATMLAGCTTTAAEEMAGNAAATDPMSPTSAPGYMQMAASSDMFEMQSSQLALQASNNPAVRSFAQMMISDHSRTTNELMGAAQQLGLRSPPPQMLPHHAEMIERLRAAPPAEFDRAYRNEQIMAHEEAVTLHRNFAQQGDAPPLRAVAARAVPIVEMHLAQARSLPDYVAAPVQSTPYYPEPAPPARRRSGERG